MSEKAAMLFSLFLILLVGCAPQAEEAPLEVMEEKEEPMMEEEITPEEMQEKAIEAEEMIKEKVMEVEDGNWRNIEFADVATGEKFKISDFAGKPVLVESFAVWCPICLQQQKKIKELKESEGDAIIHVSLDTDPNEDEEIVRAHVERNNLNWFFAVSPIDATNSLIDEFGISVVNAPSAPVILVCEDQSARLLKRGVKSADTLLSEINKGC